MNSPEVRVYPDQESLGLAAAELIAAHAEESATQRGRFSVALSGGGTPRRTYEILAQEPFRGRVPWPRLHVFWSDERCVPPDDPRSNVLMARSALLNYVPVPPAQIHPIPYEEPAHKAAYEYEALLRSFFNGQDPCLDLILLGLGEDGHTASLFPGSPVLEERERWVTEVFFAEQGMYRVTFTVPLINHAGTIVFLVVGPSKAQALWNAVKGPRAPLQFPAQLIRPIHGRIIWLVDQSCGAGTRPRSPSHS